MTVITPTEESLVTKATVIDEALEKRYKAVKRVKNRLTYRLRSRKNLLVSNQSRIKDAAKLGINKAKIEEIDRALSLIEQV